jgi:histidinol-phosphate/aromatic aminotransferase/cobyric acid decarboxylase-like protein
VIAALDRVRVPWAASSVAQAAAVAALSDAAVAHVADTMTRLRAEAGALAEWWRAARGTPTVPSATHYVLLDVGDASRARAALRERAAIAVRDCRSFGLPAHIRVAARTPPENDALRAALRSLDV